MIDCHTHTGHSHDTDVSAEDMIKRAIKLGGEYYAITDHSDKDYGYTLPRYGEMEQLNTVRHIIEINELKEKYAKEIYVGLGIELSHCKGAEQDYLKQLAMTDSWDIVVNSVHTVNGHDIYYPYFYEGRSKRESYNEYLQAVIDSINAPYSYDTIAHLGYCTRKSIYDDFCMRYSEHSDMLDTILKLIIAKDKTLEVNTHCRGDLALPGKDILLRYRELGGDNITFGSDAHQVVRVLDKYRETSDMVKALGFTHYTIYKHRKPIRYAIK